MSDEVDKKKPEPDVEREAKVPEKGRKAKKPSGLWGFPFYRRGRILPWPDPGSVGPGNPVGTNEAPKGGKPNGTRIPKTKTKKGR